MRFLKPFMLAVIAGVCIGFGGLLNLTCISQSLKILGGILFSIGLLTICLFGFKLFTGQVGYILGKEKGTKKKFLGQLAIFYLGNLVGAVGLGYLLRLTALNTTEFMAVSESLATHKLVNLGSDIGGQSFYSVLILAFFCGMLVFFAVEMFRREESPALFRVIAVITCVSAFVISGFEHCIADMFYLAFANTFEKHFGESLLSIVCGSTGNILGAFAAYYLVSLTKKAK
jgi:formate/nitrite transporter FocA (FNT family)